MKGIINNNSFVRFLPLASEEESGLHRGGFRYFGGGPFFSVLGILTQPISCHFFG
jgi:hypothetical protein